MAQEKGFVNKGLEIIIPLHLTNGQIIEVALDTGFNGSLLLPREFAEENNMEFAGREPVTMVEKHQAEIDAVTGEFNWLGRSFFVRVLVSDFGECLMGTQMLVDSKLEVDYKNLTVIITK